MSMTENTRRHPLFIDLTGQRFGRLVVLSWSGFHGGRSMWRCTCDCGVTKDVIGVDMRKGRTNSCGCLREESRTRNHRSHGMADSPEYAAWHAMRTRCTNPNCREWQYYGARGIRVCARWAESFEVFYSDMGPRPSSSYSIDRIDVNGHYEPSNCRWATMNTQQSNKRSNTMLTYQGRTQHLAAWARELGFAETTIIHRRSLGWSDDKVLGTPSRKRRR